MPGYGCHTVTHGGISSSRQTSCRGNSLESGFGCTITITSTKRFAMNAKVCIGAFSNTCIYTIWIANLSQTTTHRWLLCQCLAVDIRYLPPGLEFTNTPQKNCNSLTIDDLLLSSEDGKVLVKCAVSYVMEFLVTHFKDLASMAKLVPNVHIQCRSQQYSQWKFWWMRNTLIIPLIFFDN